MPFLPKTVLVARPLNINHAIHVLSTSLASLAIK